MNIKDIKIQAQWEIDLEIFELEVQKMKVKLREKKAWFPWRVKLININGDKNGN